MTFSKLHVFKYYNLIRFNNMRTTMTSSPQSREWTYPVPTKVSSGPWVVPPCHLIPRQPLIFLLLLISLHFLEFCINGIYRVLYKFLEFCINFRVLYNTVLFFGGRSGFFHLWSSFMYIFSPNYYNNNCIIIKLIFKEAKSQGQPAK